MPEPRKLRVFLCHASQDKLIVHELYQRLLAEGWIDPWLDEEKLLPGQDWDLEIEKAVEKSDATIVFLSSTSTSKEGYVQKEIKYALTLALFKPEETIFILPLRLDDCTTPRNLRSIQHLDYFPANRKEWALGRLLQSLKLRAQKLGIPIIKDGEEILHNEIFGDVHKDEIEKNQNAHKFTGQAVDRSDITVEDEKRKAKNINIDSHSINKANISTSDGYQDHGVAYLKNLSSKHGINPEEDVTKDGEVIAVEQRMGSEMLQNINQDNNFAEDQKNDNNEVKKVQKPRIDKSKFGLVSIFGMVLSWALGYSLIYLGNYFIFLSIAIGGFVTAYILRQKKTIKNWSSILWITLGFMAGPVLGIVFGWFDPVTDKSYGFAMAGVFSGAIGGYLTSFFLVRGKTVLNKVTVLWIPFALAVGLGIGGSGWAISWLLSGAIAGLFGGVALMSQLGKE